MEVGVRELKNHLSHYLSVVASGEEVVVTDRRTAVAKIVPLSAHRTIDRLVKDGVVTPAAAPKRPMSPSSLRAAGSVSALVAEQRR